MHRSFILTIIRAVIDSFIHRFSSNRWPITIHAQRSVTNMVIETTEVWSDVDRLFTISIIDPKSNPIASNTEIYQTILGSSADFLDIWKFWTMLNNRSFDFTCIHFHKDMMFSNYTNTCPNQSFQHSYVIDTTINSSHILEEISTRTYKTRYALNTWGVRYEQIFPAGFNKTANANMHLLSQQANQSLNLLKMKDVTNIQVCEHLHKTLCPSTLNILFSRLLSHIRTIFFHVIKRSNNTICLFCNITPF